MPKTNVIIFLLIIKNKSYKLYSVNIMININSQYFHDKIYKKNRLKIYTCKINFYVMVLLKKKS